RALRPPLRAADESGRTDGTGGAECLPLEVVCEVTDVWLNRVDRTSESAVEHCVRPYRAHRRQRMADVPGRTLRTCLRALALRASLLLGLALGSAAGRAGVRHLCRRAELGVYRAGIRELRTVRSRRLGFTSKARRAG